MRAKMRFIIRARTERSNVAEFKINWPVLPAASGQCCCQCYGHHRLINVWGGGGDEFALLAFSSSLCPLAAFERFAAKI